MNNTNTQTHVEKIWKWLETVPDPEIPVISVVDLGIVRNVKWKNNKAEITITPTYTGCPAMSVIPIDIQTTLEKKGIEKIEIKTQIAPAWTTEWISKHGKEKLEKYGIAAPNNAKGPKRCPQCQSEKIEKISQFGSTPCKAQWKCSKCLEPFDYFKCI